MGHRCRILVAVEPPVLRSALGDVLAHIGADDVTIRAAAELESQTFDAAIVTGPPAGLPAKVVIETPLDGLTVGHVHADGTVVPVTVTAPAQLLTLLDRYCPTTVVRADQVTTTTPDRNGGFR